MYPGDKFEGALSGTCTTKRLKRQVTNVLWKIYENSGEKKYKALCCEHDFPTELYQKLYEYQTHAVGRGRAAPLKASGPCG
jgi:uncharacterized protein YxeA